ncbi:MAG: signal recognition particle-docking protein FtsY [Solirubrobacteraceae bacterium]
MARDWTDLVLLPQGASAPKAEEPEARRGFFRRFREGLGRTREALGAEVRATLLDTLDAEAWERLEEALIGADVGAPATARIVARLEEVAGTGATGEQLTDELTRLLAAGATVSTEEARSIDLRHTPSVILVVGVNGTGKTTSTGKLAHHLRTTLGLKVVLGAADTFRAAAVEQLQVWGDRSGTEVITGPPESDPGAVAFQAIDRAIAIGADVVLIDTAGRLHTQDQLMAELGKIRRVIGNRLEGAPHETLLTIDATTGQNGLRQAEIFSSVTPVDGIVLTKLDGTAKGGIAIAIADKLRIPVKLVGVGEQVDDLRPFDADDFASALLK